MHRGYIKIWRKLQDSFIYDDAEALKLWIYLLFEANHKDREFMFNGQKMICKRGQLIAGRKSLAEKTNINESKVYRILKMLKSEQMIEQVNMNRYSLISITSYNQHQTSEQENEQPVNSQRTASEQLVNTPKELKNDKNDKNVNNISGKLYFEINTLKAQGINDLVVIKDMLLSKYSEHHINEAWSRIKWHEEKECSAK